MSCMKEDIRMIDLSLISIGDMVKELKNRFDVFVIYGVRRKTTVNEDTFYADWSGGVAGCLGACKLLETDILKKKMEDFDNEDLQKDVEL